MTNFRRYYALAVLTAIYMFNLIDRQLITVLAPYIKADLKLSDAQIALLYGTAFSLFYGFFGVPLAKLADKWIRTKTLAIGLTLWSVMTSVSGLVQSFAHLGLARAAVGIGEASSSPAAVSLICDYFSPRRRGTAFAIYSLAVYIGGGVSLILGGSIVAWWAARYGTPDAAPLGLSGWRAAFIIVGIPGVLLALLVALTLKEPQRCVPIEKGNPLVAVGDEAANIIPPFSYLRLLRGAPSGYARANLLALVAITILALGAMIGCDQLLKPEHRGLIASPFGVAITANTVQWLCLGIAIYGSISWAQSLKARDARVYDAIFGSRAYRYLLIGGGAVATGMHSISAFVFLYAVRYLGATPDFAIQLGVLSAIAGIFGCLMGGSVGDWLRQRLVIARVAMLMACFTVFVAACMTQFSSDSPIVFQAAYCVGMFALSAWSPLINATAQELLPEDVRGRGYAALQLGTAVVGLGTGPYLIGLISDSTGSLRAGILVIIGLTLPFALWGFSVLAREMSGMARRAPAAETA